MEYQADPDLEACLVKNWFCPRGRDGMTELTNLVLGNALDWFDEVSGNWVF